MNAAPRSGITENLTHFTVRDLIERQAERYSDKVFLIDPDTEEVSTYGDMLSLSKSIAVNIKNCGIGKGESVSYALSNGRECAMTILGILYGGFRATAINLVAGTQAISYVLEHSETPLIITEPCHDQLLDQALAENQAKPERLYADELFTSNTPELSGSVLPDLEPDDDGILMYTSGTTGRPKGVVLTQSNMVASGSNTMTAHELSPDDRALCVLPLYHINGLCVTLMGPLVSGGSVVIPHRFSSSAFWGLLRKYSCTWFSVVPTQISYLLHGADKERKSRTGLNQVRFGRSASAPLSPDVQSAFEKRFAIPIIETMGLTETAAPILSNPLPPGLRKIGSPGVAVGNEVMITDDRQRELPLGDEGEVLVRGPNVMCRYLKNEDATKDALSADGWFRTGDLGRMDEDGYVFITGRLKELIIKGGENIAPREIDEALYAHPDIIEAAAIAQPCDIYGQRVEAAVVVRADSAVTDVELLEFCKSRLGKFKTPDRIYFFDELPKGPSGKIQRAKIAELIPAGRHP